MQKILILMGAPGSGKGTQSEFLSEKLDIPHISTGNILRSEIAKGSETGNKAKEYVESGLLVPDDIILETIQQRVSFEKGALFDGFPRTTAQAQALDAVLAKKGKSISLVIHLNLSDEEVISRLSDRAICSNCGRPHKLSGHPNQADKPCGNCGGKLEIRSDDDESAVKTRLEVYKSETKPLFKYYQEKGILNEVNGHLSISEVGENILTVLES